MTFVLVKPGICILRLKTVGMYFVIVSLCRSMVNKFLGVPYGAAKFLSCTLLFISENKTRLTR